MFNRSFKYVFQFIFERIPLKHFNMLRLCYNNTGTINVIQVIIMIWKSSNIEDTQRFAQYIYPYFKTGDVISLKGDLGAGKTQFVKAVAPFLGVKETITSPSFTIMEQYPCDLGIFYHVDLYRLKNQREIETIDYDTFLYPDGITFIEWAEKAEEYLPNTIIEIHIFEKDNVRYFELTGHSKRTMELQEILKNEPFISD